MKKRTAGLSGILALSAAFAVLVSACYNPRFGPYFMEITGVELNETELDDLVQGDTRILTATLRPSNVNWEGVRVEWTTDCDGAVVGFFGELPTEFHGNVTSSVTITADSPGSTRVTVTVTVPVEDGNGYREHRFEATCMVTIISRPD